MSQVASKDGTTIVYDKAGSGPAVIVIGCGPADRTVNTPLAELLAKDFTVYNYDRRGHGESGLTPPYTLDSDIEDLQVMIDEAGGPAPAFATSGGGMLAVHAVARGVPITKLALWEVPYVLPGTRTPVPADYRDQMYAMREEGRYGDMLELFFVKAALMPDEFVAGMKSSPFWDAMAAPAACLAYDADVSGDFSMPTDLLKAIAIPTIMIDGGTTPWLSATAEAIADNLPNSKRATLEGQPHNVDPAAIAPVLAEFFAA